MADTDDPGAAWDSAGALSRLRVNTTASTARRGYSAVGVRRFPEPAAARGVRRELSEIDPGLRATLRALLAGQEPWPLYLWGPAGTGKTSAALALLDHCGPCPLKGQWSPDVWDWLHGFVEVRHVPRVKIGADRGAFCWSRDGNAGDVTWDRLARDLRDAPVAVYDEIGVGREASDFRLDVLIEVLNLRADDPVRPFVVTSNLPPSEVARVVYDDRVASRILSGTIFHLAGADRRAGG